jgi:hypothetical protein
MLDDSDVGSTRHARAAVGGLISGLSGTGAVYVSGGAEHQGPVAVIARVWQAGWSLEIQAAGREDHVFLTNSWHQPLRLISPWTTLHAFGGWKSIQPSQRWSPFGVSWYLASAWLSFSCAVACEITVAAAPPSASAVPVSATRREMRGQSFLSLFMIDSHQA